MLNYEFEHSLTTDLNGPFGLGSSGTLHLIGQDPVFFTITAVDETGFTDETPIPGGVLVTHRVQIEDAADLAPHLGPAVTEDVPEAMAALVARAETVSVA